MIGQQICGVMPVSLIQALAAAVYRDGRGNTFLNVTVLSSLACNCEAVYDCSMQGVDLENFVVSNVFGVDSCGNTVLKLGYCEDV